RYREIGFSHKARLEKRRLVFEAGSAEARRAAESGAIKVGLLSKNGVAEVRGGFKPRLGEEGRLMEDTSPELSISAESGFVKSWSLVELICAERRSREANACKVEIAGL